jgi:hypothetical protein
MSRISIPNPAGCLARLCSNISFSCLPFPSITYTITANMNAESLRWMLFVCLVAMYLLAIFYLRGRRLSFTQFVFWGLFAMFLPALGPFLVIFLEPGQALRRSPSVITIKRR